MMHPLRQTALVIIALTNALLGAGYFPPTTLNDTTWERVSPATLGWDTEKVAPLLAYLESNNTRAFIVLKGGRIAIEHYFGSFTKDSLWYWASAGKTLTSFMVGLAQQEGRLSIQDKTSRWLGQGWTDCLSAKEDLITIQHQLTMTTGLNDGVADPYCTTDSCLTYVADAGTRWAYHNAPYTLLDKVIESATGQTLNAYVTSRLRLRTGIAGAFVKSGFNNLFVSTPRTMARFGLLMLNHGVWGTDTILRDTSYFRQMTSTSQDINKSYGYLWWLNGKSSYMVPQSQTVVPGMMCPQAPADMVAALGKNGQFINVVPSLDLVFVRMGDAPESSLVPFLLNNGIWERLTPIIATNSAGVRRVLPSHPRSADTPGGRYDLRGRSASLGNNGNARSGVMVEVDGKGQVRKVLF